MATSFNVALARGIFHHDDDNSTAVDSHNCPIENAVGPPIIKLVGDFTYHQFATILSAALAIASSLIAGSLVLQHSLNYSHRVQQRQIIRVILLIPWVSLFCFLIVWRDDVGEYLVESLDVGCAVALSAFLLLMCDFVLSHSGGFDDLFGADAESRDFFVGESPNKLKCQWYGVLQFIPASITIWIVTAISLAIGIYCKVSNSPRFAHIWIISFKFVLTTLAILSCLQFYSKNKAKLLQHHILLKLFTFKTIIGLNALQTIIISILAGNGTLKPSKYMTYHDVNQSLSALILACEMPLFALMLLFAFPVSPYKGAGRAATPISVIVDALNISDLLSAFVRGPMRLVREQQKQILRQDSAKMGGTEMGLMRGASSPAVGTPAKNRPGQETGYV